MLGTKAETLERLAPLVKSARVLPQVRFTVEEWKNGREDCLRSLRLQKWSNEPLIVRSSAIAEDNGLESHAGRFSTIGNVLGLPALEEAVHKVILSFNGRGMESDQVFIQPFLGKVLLSGVAFSRDLNGGGPYLTINYNEGADTSEAVTSGRSNECKIFCFHKFSKTKPSGPLADVITLVRELEGLLQTDSLDIEFAVSEDGHTYLLQARPMTTRDRPRVSDEEHRQAIQHIHRKISDASQSHPYLYGARAVYGVMPDWNPAEIIGIRPRPLALSLYKELITDNIWAYQRDNYGYRNLRSFPLLLSFFGLPYIDVRVSFNSFIPADLEPILARRLVDYYIDRLVENPSHHDKVEFDVIYSCYTLDLPQKLERLRKYGFSEADCRVLSRSLCSLTNRIIHDQCGLWRKDAEKNNELESRRITILDSSLDCVSKIYWLLEDCKRYGTLPFAGLARAAFIAVQLLKSLASVEVLSAADYEKFMSSLNTVGSRLTRDFGKLGKGEFLKRYGHLRPGTYDILSPRYDEEPDKYFDWSKRLPLSKEPLCFVPTDRLLKQTTALLKEHELDYDAGSFFNFIKEAIQAREHAKFVFSRSLSDALSLFKEFAAGHGVSAEEASYAEILCIHKLYASSEDGSRLLRESIESGKNRFELTKAIALPPLIFEADQVWRFELPLFEPNFVTQGVTTGEVVFEKDGKGKICGNILFLPCADPGYDWIFAHGIAGFITMYGGANSHMAIRAAELGIPAVIGAGEKLYSSWSKAQKVRIDCANRQVQVLR